MTAHNLLTLADALATGAQPSADSISSLPVFEASNASGELFHLRPGQSVPWHRHLHGDDIFYGLQGHALVRVVDDDARIVEHDLAHGTLVVVRAGSAHTVVLDSPSAAYLLLQAPGDESDIHYEPGPAEDTTDPPVR
jgi:quercetin dioxygenase-like cupin family protein